MTDHDHGDPCLRCALEASRPIAAALKGDPCSDAAYEWPPVTWVDDSAAEPIREDRDHERGQRLARYFERREP